MVPRRWEELLGAHLSHTLKDPLDPWGHHNRMVKAHRLVLQESMVAQWPQTDHLGQECHMDHQDLEWRPWVDHQGQTWVLLDLIWAHQGHVQEWPLVLPGLA